MMTRNVISQTAKLFESSASNLSSKSNVSGNSSSSFDRVMDSSLKAKDNDSSNTSTKDTKQVENSVKDTKDYESKNKVKTEKKSDVNNTKETNTSSNTKEVSKVEETDLPEDAEFAEKITSMLEQIQEITAEILNISTEDLEKLMSQLGITAVDLLNPDNLKQLVLENNGATDISAVLIDESLANTMNQLTQAMETVKEEANLPLTEDQIKSILTRAENDLKAPVEQTAITKVVSGDGDQEIATAIMNSTKEKVAQDNPITKENNPSNITKDIEVIKISGNESSDTRANTETGSEESSEAEVSEHMNTFIDNLVVASSKTEVDFNGQLIQTTEIRDVANQIIEQIKVVIKPEQTSMELHLNPENLGKVNLTISEKNGMMSAQFVVQNEVAKEAIESQMHVLRDTLNQQGLKVEAIEVTVSNFSFNQSTETNSEDQAQQNRSRRSISLEEAMNLTDLTGEESLALDMMEINGNSVDFTA